MARNREFDESAAIDRAMSVFWRLGFDATSLPDLLHATGLSRSSLYLAFGGKEALFERCVEAYADRMVGELHERLDHTASPSAFLRQVFLEAAAGKDRRGCMVMNTANELGQREPRVGKLLAIQVSRFEGLFALAVERAAKAGELRPGTDVRALAQYLVCSLSGLRTMSKAGLSAASLRSAAEIVLGSLR